MKEGNLVGINYKDEIIKKDIYIIRNKINNKVYIGQSKNAYRRFTAHKTAAKTGHYKNRSLLYEAMQKYGIDKFFMEIIEKQIVNYNEREQYWIQQYNSIVPNGYNILPGGEQYPNFKGIEAPDAAVKSLEILNAIINDLQNTLTPQTDLAKKYNVSINTIHGINKGSTYFNNNLNYPLRKEKIIRKLNKEDILQIQKLLKEEKETIVFIAEKFNVSENTINSINKGLTHKDITQETKYPIRKEKVVVGKLTEETVDEIINLILNTKLSYREIGRRFNINHKIVLGIKNGTTKKYRKDNLQYPLRPNN